MLLPLRLSESRDTGSRPFNVILTDFKWVFMLMSTPAQHQLVSTEHVVMLPHCTHTHLLQCHAPLCHSWVQWWQSHGSVSWEICSNAKIIKVKCNRAPLANPWYLQTHLTSFILSDGDGLRNTYCWKMSARKRRLKHAIIIQSGLFILRTRSMNNLSSGQGRFSAPCGHARNLVVYGNLLTYTRVYGFS